MVTTLFLIRHGDTEGAEVRRYCEALGMTLKNIFRIEQDYGALNIIEFEEYYPVVKLMNGRDATGTAGVA
ncbi:MAG: hypothetical protein M1497_14785 [Nitrospirae bacterium]|nr:hypothetical protein [Nitrospirota bacterium]